MSDRDDDWDEILKKSLIGGIIEHRVRYGKTYRGVISEVRPDEFGVSFSCLWTARLQKSGGFERESRPRSFVVWKDTFDVVDDEGYFVAHAAFGDTFLIYPADYKKLESLKVA